MKTSKPVLSRRTWLQSSGALALWLGSGRLAWGAEVLAVRLWPANDYTRVTLESDVALNATYFLTKDGPPRVVIDIDGLQLSPTLRELVGKVRPDDPYIAGLRVGQNRPKVVRMVIDLKQPVKPEVFPLAPVAAYRHRLVFDLHPVTMRDPLIDLVKSRGGPASVVASTPLASPPPRSGGSGSGPAAVPGDPAAAPAPSATAARTGAGPQPSAAPPASPLPTTRPAGMGSTAPSGSSTPGASTPGPSSAFPPAGGAAPSAQSRQAAATVGDALDDFIGNLEKNRRAGSTEGGADASASAGTRVPGSGNEARAPTGALNGEPRGPSAAGDAGPAAASAQARAANEPLRGDGTDRLIVVALDPGHGGEDPGAIGPSGMHEKVVALQIARKLRERLEARGDIRVLMTRDDDFFVPLNERVNKARRVQADLFVSIHADAFLNQQARGASVFALSERGATSAAARWMAQRENASDGIGGVNIKVRDASVMRALLDMSTTAQIKDSLRLGAEVLGRIGRVGRLHKPRVEQASFAVLKAPDIPSILVETGFISNPDEETKLRDPDYQDQLADALAAGIRRYFAKNPPLARKRT